MPDDVSCIPATVPARDYQPRRLTLLPEGKPSKPRGTPNPSALGSFSGKLLQVFDHGAIRFSRRVGEGPSKSLCERGNHVAERRADELRNELEGIATALDRDDVDAARAKLQTLISTLHERKKVSDSSNNLVDCRQPMCGWEPTGPR
jgi:hypothetical protein